MSGRGARGAGGPGRPGVDAGWADAAWAESWTAGALRQLRADGYRPPAWVLFLARSWRQARYTARRHPALARSWVVESAALAALTLALAAGRWRDARRAALALAVLGGQVGDTYVHLGLNRAALAAPLFPALGPPLALTHLRGALGAAVLADLLAHGGRPPGYGDGALLALSAVAGLSDLLDGPLARRTGRCTQLGQWHDGLADAVCWLATFGQLVARGRLPAWFPPLAALRFALPAGAGAWCYFARVAPAPAGHTAWGRASGVLLGLVVGAALAPRRWRPAPATLGAAGAAALAAATLAQLRRVPPPT
ncbi:MAG TPA: CDP-alcohol phosphatidyltransferase family protein [Thermomicrobiales bacterium]|nr:CDP-alcohol phosphatidyltransferase family protein [Thermomicrobiales bacterium]